MRPNGGTMRNKWAHRLAVRIALVLLAWCADGATAARAQTPSPAQSPSPAQPSATQSPVPSTESTSGVELDLSITATVTARELRFEKVPNPKVEFTGKPKRNTVWESDRQNLPPQVRPGETYRDIGIRLRITSVFADIERIVAEALGEIPRSDDAPPPSPAPTPGQQQPPRPPGETGSPQTSAQPPDGLTTEQSPDAATPTPPSSANPSPAAAPAPRSRTNGARANATTRRRGGRP